MEVSLQRKNSKRRFLEKIRDSWGRIKLQHSRNHQSSVNHIYTKSYVPRSTGKPNHFRRMACFQALLSLHSHQIHSVGWYYDDDNKYLIGAVLLDWKDTVGHWGALSCPYIYSGRGVGTKLVQTSINFFKSMENVKKIEITVLSTKNERLVAWYEQKGLKKIDGEYDFVAPKIVLDEYKGKIKMISMEMPCV